MTTFWLPTTVKSLSRGSTSDALLYSGLFYTCGLFSVFLAGQSCDRTGERKWHCVAGQVLTAAKMDSHNRFDAPEEVHPAPFRGARWTTGKLGVAMPAKSIVVLKIK